VRFCEFKCFFPNILEHVFGDIIPVFNITDISNEEGAASHGVWGEAPL